MKSFGLIFGLVAIFAVTAAENLQNYDKYAVYQVTFDNMDQYNILDVLRVDSGVTNYSVWLLNKEDKFAHVMVHPDGIPKFKDLCILNNIKNEVLIMDVQKAIAKQGEGFVKTVLTNYEGFKLYQLTCTTEEQLIDLRWWRITSGTGNFAFWKVNEDKKFAHIMVNPDQVEIFEAFVKEKKYGFESVIDNVQELIPIPEK